MARRKKSGSKKKSAGKKAKLTAKTADRHILYQRSVQAPDFDAEFLAKRYKKATGKPLRFLREDFCGTFLLSCEFVKMHRDNRALGVDLDEPTLEWGRQHNLAALTPKQQERVTLMQANVLDVTEPKAEVIAAMNFSYCVFKTRDELRRYFEVALESLEPGGLLVLDLYGGSGSQEEQEEETAYRDFTYVWDQDAFDPITYHVTCRIHFRFKDKTALENAFVYEWRLWTLPELQELLTEAGFEDVHVLWETTDKDTGEGSGVYRRAKKGEADEAWIAYVVGQAPE
ncbi:MAG: class I SAM-dependent methyltransferase [Planctomycetota bacterium]